LDRSSSDLVALLVLLALPCLPCLAYLALLTLPCLPRLLGDRCDAHAPAHWGRSHGPSHPRLHPGRQQHAIASQVTAAPPWSRASGEQSATALHIRAEVAAAGRAMSSSLLCRWLGAQPKPPPAQRASGAAGKQHPTVSQEDEQQPKKRRDATPHGRATKRPAVSAMVFVGASPPSPFPPSPCYRPLSRPPLPSNRL